MTNWFGEEVLENTEETPSWKWAERYWSVAFSSAELRGWLGELMRSVCTQRTGRVPSLHWGLRVVGLMLPVRIAEDESMYSGGRRTRMRWSNAKLVWERGSRKRSVPSTLAASLTMD